MKTSETNGIIYKNTFLKFIFIPISAFTLGHLTRGIHISSGSNWQPLNYHLYLLLILSVLIPLIYTSINLKWLADWVELNKMNTKPLLNRIKYRNYFILFTVTAFIFGLLMNISFSNIIELFVNYYHKDTKLIVNFSYFSELIDLNQLILLILMILFISRKYIISLIRIAYISFILNYSMMYYAYFYEYSKGSINDRDLNHYLITSIGSLIVLFLGNISAGMLYRIKSANNISEFTMERMDNYKRDSIRVFYLLFLYSFLFNLGLFI